MKKTLSAILAAFIAATCFTAMPINAADTSSASVGTQWKFDFGPENQTVSEGCHSVTPTTEFNATEENGVQYGLLGQNENDYKLANHVDGVTVIKGQVVSYTGAGSGDTPTADCLGIGTLNADQIDGLYPIRFAMAAESNAYYEVKVSYTTLDSSKDASGIFVYSERRHPVVTNDTLTAGETKTVTFRATIQNVLVKDRANGGTITYNDDKLNVLVMGNNAAISYIEVTKIDPSTTKTIWCYDDSTGCDYPMPLPYFPLQNYGGTAQYLSKYLPNNIALVNQGDGGLGSGSVSYFTLCKKNFKAGDYIYMQYGHNDSSAASYLKNLPTYYNGAHDAGAYMIFVGPIDRHNDSQYDASTNAWSSTLQGYSRAAKAYTEILICAGTDAGNTFISKAQTSMDSAYEYYDEVIAAGITSAGVKDVAFVDLNAPTISWLGQICTEVKNIKGSETYNRAYSDYYFRSAKGTAVDGTHENDYGADATASFFFDGIHAKADAQTNTIEGIEYSILSPLVTNMRAAYGSWDHVSADVINAGSAPNSAWPDVFKSKDAAAFPTKVTGISWNNDGTVSSVTILKQESTKSMDDYGMLKLDIYDKDSNLKGTIKSTQVDNTWSDGTTTVFSVNGQTSKLTGATDTVYSKENGDTFKAVIYRASKGDGAELEYIVTGGEYEAYSDEYVPTPYEGTLLTNEDGDAGEDFNYYGIKYDGSAGAEGHNGWLLPGSATRSALLNKDGDRYYVTPYFNDPDGNKSMNFYKKFQDSPAVSSTGRLHMSVELRNAASTNTGAIQFTLASNYSGNYPQGQMLNMFTVCGNKLYVNGNTSYDAGDVSGSTWTTVTADADLDRGTLTVKVGDNNAVTAPINGLQKNIGAEPTLLRGICISKTSITSKAKCSAGVDVTNLLIDKHSPADDLDKKTLTVNKTGNGTVLINGSETDSISAAQSSSVTLKAIPADFYYFNGWKAEDNSVLSTDTSYTYPRLYESAAVTAEFISSYGSDKTASYIEGLTDDFEGETNIFNITNKSVYKNDDGSVTNDIKQAASIVPTGNFTKSVFGNVLGLGTKNSGALEAKLSSPVTLTEGQFVETSFNLFHGYLNKNSPSYVIGLYDKNGNSLAEFKAMLNDPTSNNISDIKIGQTAATAAESAPDNFQYNLNNGIGSYDFTSESKSGLVKIKINAGGEASISFTNAKLGSTVYTYTGNITAPISVGSIKITTTNGSTAYYERQDAIDNISTVLVKTKSESQPTDTPTPTGTPSATPTPIPTDTPDKTVSLVFAETTVAPNSKVNYTANNATGYTVYIAQYTANGKLCSLTVSKPDSDSYVGQITADMDCSYIKGMIWNSDYAPMINAVLLGLDT